MSDTSDLEGEKPLKFHPEFDNPKHSGILQAGDNGQLFRYDLTLLAALSSFFRDVNSIPSPATGSSHQSVIALPHAPAGALTFALHGITAICWGGVLPNLPLDSSSVNSLCEKLVTLVDAYDLQIVRHAFLAAAGRAYLQEKQSHPPRVDAFQLLAYGRLFSSDQELKTIDVSDLLKPGGIASMDAGAL